MSWQVPQKSPGLHNFQTGRLGELFTVFPNDKGNHILSLDKVSSFFTFVWNCITRGDNMVIAGCSELLVGSYMGLWYFA